MTDGPTNDDKKLEAVVLAAVRDKPGETADSLRETLAKQGHSPREVRSAVARLWDRGQLNLSIDRKLTATHD